MKHSIGMARSTFLYEQFRFFLFHFARLNGKLLVIEFTYVGHIRTLHLGSKLLRKQLL